MWATDPDMNEARARFESECYDKLKKLNDELLDLAKRVPGRLQHAALVYQAYELLLDTQKYDLFTQKNSKNKIRSKLLRRAGAMIQRLDEAVEHEVANENDSEWISMFSTYKTDLDVFAAFELSFAPSV